MAFAGVPSADERADILNYLRTLSDTPIDVPPAPPADSLRAVKPAASPQPAAEVNSFAELQRNIDRQLEQVDAEERFPVRLLYGKSDHISFVIKPKNRAYESESNAGNDDKADNASEKSDDAQLDGRIRRFPEKIVPLKFKVSTQVKASLTDVSGLVAVKQVGDAAAQIKSITLNDRVEWIWEITPKSGGTAQLQLELIAFIREKGRDKDIIYPVRTLKRLINIEISTFDRLKKFAADIGPIWTLILPVGGAIGGLLTFIRKMTSSARSSP